jgi:ribosomal protein RSM22 (predicted rRNA methylase)
VITLLTLINSRAEEFTIEDGDFESKVVRGSEEASFGRKRIGCVQLPTSLKSAIQDTVSLADKPLVRTDALRIYDSFRSTSKIPVVEPTRKFDKRVKAEVVGDAHTITYGERETMAYVAGALPATYAAIYNVMKELKERVCSFKPKTMLDFGTGPGTGLWYVDDILENISK